MALRNSNIVNKLKESFMNSIKDNLLYLDYSKEEKENYIKEKYNLSDVYNFDKELSNKIKAFAVLESKITTLKMEKLLQLMLLKIKFISKLKI